MIFQPTPSLRRATSWTRASRRWVSHFNPRPPCGGRRWAAAWRACICIYFNPRPPCGGRRQQFGEHELGDGISTHALLAEGDTRKSSKSWKRILFQPTPSLRRATISSRISASRFSFQPTPSLRRATANLNNSTNCYLFKFARFVCSSRHMLSLKFQRYP